LNDLVGRIAKGGEIVLAGFYTQPLQFAFPPAFMKEARFRVAAEWARDDLAATRTLVENGALSLDGLITHQVAATDAPGAYRTAFEDPTCLKMILNWETPS
jgi:3-hydroxyethyl bacteriochlorophyllide a dehydrogenase